MGTYEITNYCKIQYRW